MSNVYIAFCQLCVQHRNTINEVDVNKTQEIAVVHYNPNIVCLCAFNCIGNVVEKLKLNKSFLTASYIFIR